MQRIAAQFFMGSVAYRDDQIRLVRNTTESPWDAVDEVDAMTARDRDGARGDRGRRMRARRYDRYVAAVTPQLCSELGASGVGRAHEDNAPRCSDRRGTETAEASTLETHVTPSFVRLRARPAHKSDALEHAQMVSDEIRGHTEPVLQFAR